MKYDINDIVRIKSEKQIKKEYPQYIAEPSRKALFGKLLCIKRISEAYEAPRPVEAIYYFQGVKETALSELFIEGKVS